MSAIEEAVERAKKHRLAIRKGVAGEVSRSAPVFEGGEPEYTQTRVIPLRKSHVERHRLPALLGDPEALDAYNLLRTQLLEKTRVKGHNVIMITSVLEGEGKTLTAINLAASIARGAKQTVLLVDTDLRKPRAQYYLGLSAVKGLSDYLRENVPLTELLINPGLPRMVLLCAGKPLSGSTDILGSQRMERLVKEMKRRYPERYVIFDCPPILASPDALVFSSYVDGIILVVESGRTPEEKIRKAVGLLEGKNLVGLVMNKGDEVRRG